MKKKIAVVCPYTRDIRELSSVNEQASYDLVFDDLTKDWLECLAYQDSKQEQVSYSIDDNIANVIQVYKNANIQGVFSSGDYPGSVIASIVANNLGLRGPSPYSVLSCQHKYYSRCLQQKYVPEAVPAFCMVDKSIQLEEVTLPYPLFMKPIKSYFSIHAYKIANMAELQKYLGVCNFSADFIAPFDYLLKKYIPTACSASGVILETCLEGRQVTYEGFVQDGAVYTLGIVDSIMFPGTISFQRFEYPSQLPDSVQERIADIARRFMLGIGFNNSFFNIEFFYNSQADTISIIEVNPRMASQFADLYEKVDGANSYQIALDLAAGNKVKVSSECGSWSVAASCVFRIFENKRIAALPTQENIAKVYELFPDARIELYGKVGDTLSSLLQDSMSFRYGLIHLGGRDREDIQKSLQICKNLLEYTFTSV